MEESAAIQRQYAEIASSVRMHVACYGSDAVDVVRVGAGRLHCGSFHHFMFPPGLSIDSVFRRSATGLTAAGGGTACAAARVTDCSMGTVAGFAAVGAGGAAALFC